jgi:hypothetical protein
MPRTKLLKGSVPVTFRLEQKVRQLLIDKAQREDMTVSELIRRALHREIRTGSKNFPPRKAGTNKARPEFYGR